MKKLLLSAFVLSTTYVASYAQAQRKVLFEEFTQASCGPCAQQNPAYNTLIGASAANANVPKLVALKYQVWWPGYDPMYNQNKPDVDNRVGYYGVSGVPTVFGDGNVQSDVPPSSITQTVIDNDYAITSPVSIDLTHVWSPNADSILLHVKIKNVSSSSYGTANHRLHVLLAEKHITFSAAPGTNGEKDFYGVVRKMYPSADGATFNAIAAGDSLELDYALAIPGYIYNLNQVACAAFIQDNSNKHVDNSQWSDPINVPANLTVVSVAATSTTVAPGYCNYSLTPKIKIVNSATTAITSYKAFYSLNGGAAVEKDVTGVNVVSGGNDVATFTTITLTPGVNKVDYWVNSFNYASTPSVDLNLADNMVPQQIFSSLSASAVATTIAEGFENNTTGDAAPANAILDNPTGIPFEVINGTDAGLTDLGGFGQSNKCYMFDYFTITANKTATLLFDKINLTSMATAELTFSHAYAQYQSENDKLEVKVSTDCGATWTTLFNKAGTALATAPANASNRFFPTPTQWVADRLDMNAFAGMNDVIVAFKGTSAYGNNAYIDDINIGLSTASIGKINSLNTTVNVFPNPVRNELNVRFTLTKSSKLTIDLYNAIGEKVRTVASGSYNGENTLTVNTSDLAAGIYHLNLISTEGVTTQRFVVEK